MHINRKIEILETLSQLFEGIVNPSKALPSYLELHRSNGISLIDELQHYNGWFTADVVKKSLSAWGIALKANKVNSWLKSYSIDEKEKKVGVIMAGNIPLVGLHDAIVVLVSDNHLFAKLSSKDNQLMRFVLNAIGSIDEEWKSRITISERLNDIDVLIATGSDNSARYFEYYFREKPKIIRKNRTSVAILDGSETAEDLKALADDIFTFFGLGCRNVTKVYIPKEYDKDLLFNAFYDYREIINHNKYANNYDYNKAVYLLNQVPLIENGFLLLKEDEGLHSPVGVLFYEEYEEKAAVINKLEMQAEEIQCIVSKSSSALHVNFGETQQPELWDYADGVDTMAFLNSEEH